MGDFGYSVNVNGTRPSGCTRVLSVQSPCHLHFLLSGLNLLITYRELGLCKFFTWINLFSLLKSHAVGTILSIIRVRVPSHSS